MAKWTIMVAAAAGTLLTAAPATAATGQDVPRQQVSDDQGVVVTGEDRIVCRRVTRTATRMRTGRICRSVSQWRDESGGSGETGDTNIDDAANTLDARRADCIGPYNPGGLSREPQTPLGPR